jgi:hypothetical protein
MPCIPPSVVVHKLNVDPHLKPVQQRRRRYLAKKKKSKATTEEVRKLCVASFIKEVQYTTWLSNMVVKHGVGQEIQREMENVS